MILHKSAVFDMEREAKQTMTRKSGILRRLLPLIILVLCASLVYSLVRCQMSINAKQQELASVQIQLNDQLTKNEELQRTLDDGEDAIIERIAREEGYSKPNERIWIDISGK